MVRTTHSDYCYRCGDWVEAGDGHFERNKGRWRVQHAHCAIVWRGTDQRAITRFDNEYRFLSNFAWCQVRLDGLVFPTVEHAYQAAKTEDPDTRLAVSQLQTPGQAKRAGQGLKWRKGWADMRVQVMADLLVQKFSLDPLYRRLLDETGDARIVEGNTWKDKFWGVYQGEGQNMLGELLMKIRSANRAT